MTKRIAAALTLWVASVIGWEVTRSIPPLPGLAFALAVGVSFLWWHLRPGPSRSDRLALARITRPVEPWRWVWLSVGATLALLFGISGFFEASGPTWPDSGSMAEAIREIQDFDTTVLGWIAVAVWMIGVAPIVGEFSVRGYVQGGLEERWAPLWAVMAVPALTTLIVLVSPLPWSLALLLGLTSAGTGYVAYRFQSVWPAVGVTMGSGFLAFVLPFIHGDRTSNFGGLATTYLVPLSIGLTLAGVLGWYFVLLNTKGPSPRARLEIPNGAGPAKAHTSA